MGRIVFTDGACSGNPGPGGWAWALGADDFAAGYDPATTNQRMEITAAFRAVQALDGPLEIRSDSTYVVNCFNQHWWRGWHAAPAECGSLLQLLSCRVQANPEVLRR